MAPARRLTNGVIESRIDLTAPARIFRPATDLFAALSNEKTGGVLEAVFVDEAQFLTAAQVDQLARDMR
jgi:Thymidine kinase